MTASLLGALCLAPVGIPTAGASTVPPDDLYAVNGSCGSLTPYPLGSTAPAPGPGVALGTSPRYVALSPTGSRAFVTNQGSNSVSVVDTTLGQVDATLPVGAGPEQVAVTPDGSTVYVVDQGSHDIRPIDSKTFVEGPGAVAGISPFGIAISPDGKTAYVTDSGSAAVLKFSLPALTLGAPIPVGLNPEGIAVTPDGSTLYVVNSGSGSVTPVSVMTGTPGTPIAVGTNPTNIAISPDGSSAIVTNAGSPASAPTVSVIGILSGTVQTLQLPSGDVPSAAAWVPDGSTAWITSAAGNSLVPITVSTSPGNPPVFTVGTPVTAGACGPVGVAATPDQAPVAQLTQASFSISPGGSVTFDASPSTVTYGQITEYSFFFGDGSSQQNFCATDATCYQATHTYAKDGQYTMIVYEVDTAGTDVATVFTGQTVSRNAPKNALGLPQDSAEATITVGTVVGPPPPVPLPWNQPVLFTASISSGTVQPIQMPVAGAPLSTPPIGSPIAVGNQPAFVAVTPDASTAVISNYGSNTVQAMAMCPSGNQQTYSYDVGRPAATGSNPVSVAIAPAPLSVTSSGTQWGVLVSDYSGSDLRAYVLTVPASRCGSTPSPPTLVQAWSVPLPQGNVPVPSPLPQPNLTLSNPYGIAITPDGHTAYVADTSLDAVTPVNLTNASVGPPIPVGQAPEGIAVTPDGKTVYVADSGSSAVTPITTSNNLPGQSITVGNSPDAIAITSDGQRALVANVGSNSVSDITLNNAAVQTISLPVAPTDVTISADASTAWVSSCNANAVVPIALQNDQIDSSGVVRGIGCPIGEAITPDQAPVAQLVQASISTIPNASVTIDASPSTVRYGQIVEYGWFFGDGSSAQTFCASDPTCYQESHAYASPGNYNVIVYEVDTAGTAVTTVFTGQTMSRNAPKNGAGLFQDSAQAVVAVGQTQTVGGPIPVAGTTQLLYTTNFSAGTVTPVGLSATGSPTLGQSFAVGAGPAKIAVTPDGKGAIVSDFQGQSITPLAICPDATSGNFHFNNSGQAVPTVDPNPLGIAIAPVPASSSASQEVWNVYVVEFGGNVVEQFQLTLNTASCTAAVSKVTPISASLIPVGQSPYGIVITPDGLHAYVSNSGSATVTPITLNSSSPGGQAGLPAIGVGQTPEGVAVTPDGSTVIVANSGSGTITRIATSTNTPSPPDTVGTNPTYVAVASAAWAYVTTPGSSSVTAVSLSGCSTASCPTQGIAVGSAAYDISVSPDRTAVWTASPGGGDVVPIVVATNTVRTTGVVGSIVDPLGIAVAVAP